MTENKIENNGVEFDPGFAPYIMAFQGTVEYLYMDINRFKNLSQRKMKFRQYYKKIIEVFNNNLGFYIGCLMWAAYIKTKDEQPILNNNCLGQVYDEESNVAETDFMLNFIKLFPKDIKYFLGEENFSFSKNTKLVLDMYREFLVINKGFVESAKNTDIKLPEKIKIDNVQKFGDIITEVIKSGNLSNFLEYIDIICPTQ